MYNAYLELTGWGSRSRVKRVSLCHHNVNAAVLLGRLSVIGVTFLCDHYYCQLLTVNLYVTSSVVCLTCVVTWRLLRCDAIDQQQEHGGNLFSNPNQEQRNNNASSLKKIQTPCANVQQRLVCWIKLVPATIFLGDAETTAKFDYRHELIQDHTPYKSA